MTSTAIIYPDDQTTLLVAECPELAVASQGYTEAEAMVNLREAVELHLEAFPETRPRQASVRTLDLTHAWSALG